MPHEPVQPVAPDPIDRWSNYQVPALAQILADGINPGFDRALAWGRVGSLIAAAMGSLAAAMDALNRLWAVDSSAAAYRFANEVDTLHAQMQQVSEAAYSNKAVVNRTVETFDASRAEVARLADEWNFDAIQETGSAIASSVIEGEAVGAWRDGLNNRAHLLLQASDRAAFEQSQVLHVPSDFRAGTLDPFEGKLGAGVDPIHGASGPEGSETWRSERSIDAITVHIASADHPSSPGSGSWVASLPNRVAADGNWISGIGVGRVTRGRVPSLDERAIPSQAGGRLPQSGTAAPIESPSPAHDHGSNEHESLGGMPIAGGMGASAPRRNGPQRRGPWQAERWHTAGGVPGVLLPTDREAIHDPGPGVLGIDL